MLYKNFVTVAGRLTNNINVQKTVKNKRFVTSFQLKVEQVETNKQGQHIMVNVDCTAWDQAALALTGLKKGTDIRLFGELALERDHGKTETLRLRVNDYEELVDVAGGVE